MDKVIIGSLIILVCFHLVTSFVSKDHSDFWSPTVVFSALYIYYCIIPYFDPRGYLYNEGADHNPTLFLLTALIYYICFLFAFKSTKYGRFEKLNSTLSLNTNKPFGIFLFLIAYGAFAYARGFHFSIIDDGNSVQEIEYGGVNGYLVNLFSCCYFSLCSLLIAYKSKRNIIFYICLALAIITSIYVGGRHRLVCIILSLFTVAHLYPFPKKTNVVAILTIIIVAYLAFGIMEYTRTGSGISLEAYESLDQAQVLEGSAENRTVYEFSLLATNYYNRVDVEFVHFAPILNALLFPLPRAIFPWKTFSDYGTEIKYIIAGEDSGSAWLSFTDAFMAFGWLGVIINGLLIGWLSALIWNNYKSNKQSISAILLLAIYNSWSFEFFSRGYLAQNYCNFIFMIIVPFILISITNSFIKSKR